VKRSRVNPVSKKRRDQREARDECRRVVLARDLVCRGFGKTPVECRRIVTDVHELGRGAYRQSCWLDPDLCIGLCHWCHRWVTDNPQAAVEAGLAMWGWQIEELLASRH